MKDGDEFVTRGFVAYVETMLAEHPPSCRVPLAQIAALGFSRSVRKETGSEFKARRAEKAMLRALHVPDWPWRTRAHDWFWRTWRWLRKTVRGKR